MYPPISWMSATGEAISRRISASTAARSSPTRAATRSLRTCSRVGADTPATSGRRGADGCRRDGRGGARGSGGERRAAAVGGGLRRLSGLVHRALARADLAAAGRRAVLGDDLGLRDDRGLAAQQRGDRGRDLVLLDPDVLGLARHVAEARILDEEPARLRGLDDDRGLAGIADAENLLRHGATGEGDGGQE